MRVLLVRVDRLGDVLLTTPAFSQVVRSGAEVDLLLAPPVAELLAGFEGVQNIWSWRPEEGVGAWAARLKERRYDVAVLFEMQTRVAAAVWRAGIPIRVGPLGKLPSYLFLNRGLRQKRSQVRKHEAEYGLDLLAHAGLGASRPPLLPTLGRKVQTAGARAGVAVHPGMGGSALNWPEDRYRELVAALRAQGVEVQVTAGPSEETLARRVAGESGAQVRAGLSLSGLAELYAGAAVVVAPSTGPLHLATAVGTPVLGIYPPIRVQSAKRWGPLGTRVRVLAPEVTCPEVFKCAGARCAYFDCMTGLTVEAALKHVRDLLDGQSATQKS